MPETKIIAIGTARRDLAVNILVRIKLLSMIQDIDDDAKLKSYWHQLSLDETNQLI